MCQNCDLKTSKCVCVCHCDVFPETLKNSLQRAQTNAGKRRSKQMISLQKLYINFWLINSDVEYDKLCMHRQNEAQYVFCDVGTEIL